MRVMAGWRPRNASSTAAGTLGSAGGAPGGSMRRKGKLGKASLGRMAAHSAPASGAERFSAFGQCDMPPLRTASVHAAPPGESGPCTCWMSMEEMEMNGKTAVCRPLCCFTDVLVRRGCRGGFPKGRIPRRSKNPPAGADSVNMYLSSCQLRISAARQVNTSVPTNTTGASGSRGMEDKRSQNDSVIVLCGVSGTRSDLYAESRSPRKMSFRRTRDGSRATSCLRARKCRGALESPPMLKVHLTLRMVGRRKARLSAGITSAGMSTFPSARSARSDPAFKRIMGRTRSLKWQQDVNAANKSLRRRHGSWKICDQISFGRIYCPGWDTGRGSAAGASHPFSMEYKEDMEI
ncbi:hypothetical protein DFH07DRAFT_796439 [Mycena maculata]|uniref:Uncharacterized protein n=1 Tax=Mycena maculata TaxID=230809 RepID=A0AAD7K3X1_9AGAR|nr:hypothetical protein DFH07DRAFT_796439 [Mycena maculata]